MGKRVGFKSMLIGIIKVVSFIITTWILTRLALIPLSAVSAKYWSKYDGRGLNEPWFLTSTIVMLLVTIIVSFLFIRFIEKKDWSYIRLRTDNKMKHFLSGILFSLIIVLVFTFITIITNQAELNLRLKPLDNILFYLALTLFGTFVAVINEEMISRGYVLKTFESHINLISAVVISSALFSLFHFFRPEITLLGFFNIFLMGCFIASLCIYYNSLWAPIGLHLGWNLFLYFFNFPVSGQKYPNPIFNLKYKGYSLLTGSKFGPEDSIIVTILLIVLSAYIYVKIKNRGKIISGSLPS